jgi:hypothetical protein
MPIGFDGVSNSLIRYVTQLGFLILFIVFLFLLVEFFLSTDFLQITTICKGVVTLVRRYIDDFVAVEVYLIWEPAEDTHADLVLCVGVWMTKVDGDAFSAAVGDGDALSLEALGLASGGFAAIAAV